MENEEKHLKFKQKGLILFAIGRKTDKLFEEGKINKKNKKEIKEKISCEWDKLYNNHPNISSSIKQGFNLLYC